MRDIIPKNSNKKTLTDERKQDETVAKFDKLLSDNNIVASLCKVQSEGKNLGKIRNISTFFKRGEGKKKAAFTLAEVLITLGIIGVVAAMTIPNLMTHYKKIRTVNQLKAAYSIVNQAIRLSQEDNGEPDSWDTTLSGKAFFHKYIAPYLKWQNEYSSTELQKFASRRHLNGTAYSGSFYTNDISTHFTLLNGSMVSMQVDTNTMMIGIDVNGLAQPNTIGIDTFFFILTNEYGMVPLGDKGTPAYFNYGTYSRSNVLSNTGYGCNAKGKGYWCASVIMHDSWTIADDYPWK
jgi:prepilin-type N-terminal cleavage/methylation domain-containing protein